MWPLLFALLMLSPLFVLRAEMPAQAARGKAIFFDSSKSAPCATCHELEKKGRKIGPDLTKIARLSPKAIVISILSTRTVYAREVELKNKNKYPAMIVSEDANQVAFYNLAVVPPELIRVDKIAVYAIRDNALWRHPPESTGYTPEELADVIAYIRWAAYGDTKGVRPEEVK